MSIGKRRSSSAMTMPTSAIGTVRTTASGSVQLSYCAARTRKTRTIDSAKRR
ncbi:MAG: hypothetical protein AW07_00744 [Candidatus Accumulibacter sp. SK-11]|nr:MAG: hypothetical protein AW07_00744 [Candidatus Accumulibacter sp. SK-11]